LRITGVEAITIAVPFVSDMAVLNSYEVPLGRVPKVIVRLQTDEGLVGLGETVRGFPATLLKDHESELVGRDPLELNLERPGFGWGLDEALEHALHDLAGKALGLPMYKLLGGAYRSEVPVSAWSPHHGPGNPQKTAVVAERAVSMGYDVIKLKARPWDIVETARAIRDAVGDEMGIVCDPNTQFGHPATALKLARRLERYNIICFEDPVPKNLDWYVLMRAKMDIPLALHITGSDVFNAVKREACDYINTGGTMREFKNYAGVAALAGIPVWHGSGNDLGIMEASYVHACAATSNATLTSDIFGEFCRVDDLLVEPIEIKNGQARVPNKPGLGVELDMKAVEKYRVSEHYVGKVV